MPTTAPPPPPPATTASIPAPRRRRLAPRIAICIFLAIFTSLLLIIIAGWVRAAGPQSFSSPVLAPTDPSPEWLWPPPFNWSPKADLISTSRSLGYRVRIAGSMQQSRPPQVVQQLQEEITIGWPFACLRHRSDATSQVWSTRPLGLFTLSDHGDALLFSPSRAIANSASNSSVIPLTPWWPGLFANLATWTLIYWMFLFMPWQWRRHRRIARGQCLRCGYELKGLEVCPECGNNASGPQPSTPAPVPQTLP